MEIQLKRIRQKGECIEGQILIDGQYICDTLENDHNSLPVGRYSLLVHKCHFRSRKMPLIVADSATPATQCDHCMKPDGVYINSTPHPGAAGGAPLYCPMLTPGNGIHNRHDGCILVGRRGALGLLLHPKATFDLLYQRIRKSSQRGNPISLIIEEQDLKYIDITN